MKMFQEIINSIASREALLARLSSAFIEIDRKYAGLEKASETVLNNNNEANTRKMLSTTMKVLKEQMVLNRDLIATLILLIADDDFESKQAKFAIKMGENPADILKKIMKNKFK